MKLLVNQATIDRVVAKMGTENIYINPAIYAVKDYDNKWHDCFTVKNFDNAEANKNALEKPYRATCLAEWFYIDLETGQFVSAYDFYKYAD